MQIFGVKTYINGGLTKFACTQKTHEQQLIGVCCKKVIFHIFTLYSKCCLQLATQWNLFQFLVPM